MSKVEIINTNKVKNKKNRNNNNKKKKALETRLIKAVKKETNKIASKLNFNPINHKFRRPNPFYEHHKQQILEYISSILDPELAVTSGKLVKQPSIIPIWSTTVSYMNQFTIPTNADGSFFLAWNPNMLVSQSSMPSSEIVCTGKEETLKYKAISHISVKDPAQNSLIYYSGYVPDVGLSKYRLVSAKIVINYIGPVIQKAGMLFGCATYDPTPIMYTTTADSPSYSYSVTGVPIYLPNQQGVEGATFRLLSEANIINGLWNKSVSVQNGSGSISAVSIPTDPSSKMFYPMGSYFGEKIVPEPQAIANYISGYPPASKTGLIDTSVQGTQICYLFCGKGLPQGNVLNVKVYYNFEIIPNVNAAPFLRNVMSTEFSPKEAEFIDKTVSAIQPQNLITPGNSILNSIKSSIPKVGNALSKMASVYGFAKSFGNMLGSVPKLFI